MAQQLLDGANVGAGLEQVGCEAMAQRVGRGPSADPCSGHGVFHGALNGPLENVVPSLFAGVWVDVITLGGKHILPGPFDAGLGVLAGQCAWQVDAGVVRGQVDVVPPAALIQQVGQRLDQAVGQHGHAVLVALAAAHDDAPAFQVQVFDSQAQALHQPQAGTVQQVQHQAGRAAGGRKNGGGFGGRQHFRQPPRLFRPHDVVDPPDLNAEHRLV